MRCVNRPLRRVRINFGPPDRRLAKQGAAKQGAAKQGAAKQGAAKQGRPHAFAILEQD